MNVDEYLYKIIINIFLLFTFSFQFTHVNDHSLYAYFVYVQISFIFSIPSPSLICTGQSACAGWVLNFVVELGCWTWCLSLHSSSLPVAMILIFDYGTSDSAMGMPEALFLSPSTVCVAVSGQTDKVFQH